MLEDIDITLDNVVIAANSGGFVIQPGTFSIMLGIGEEEGEFEMVDVKINSGSIENGVLTLNLGIVDVLEYPIIVSFEGVLATGIYATAADGAKAVAYYSITGKKLSAEPASGIFIVKYSNGKTIKVVK